MKPKKIYFKKIKVHELKKEKKLLSSKVDATILVLLFLGSTLINNAILQLFQNNLDWDLVNKFIFEWHTILFLLGSSVIFIFTLWLYAILGNRYLTVGLTFLISLGLGVATWQKMINRSEPLYPSELSMIKELSFMVSMIESKVVLGFLFIVLVVMALAYVFTRLQTRFIIKYNRHKSYLIRFILFITTSFLLVYIANFNQPGNLLKKAYDPNAYWIPYSQQMNYYNNGFIGGFLFNLKVEAMAEPKGYSKEKIAELTQKYQEIAEEINQNRSGPIKNTNIIYIMNESFSDPLALKGMEIAKDPIPLTRHLMENNRSGSILSQGYGGGTANIEFEALTGFSMEPMNPQLTTPYTQLLAKVPNFPSIVSYLNEQNYQTTAIHPYNTSMYKRQNVYQSLGFQNFINEDTMKNTEKMESNPYISDKAAYQEVLDTLEASKDSNFIHLVTMQNHMPYGSKYVSSEYEVSGTENDQITSNYLKDLSYSDQALDNFIKQIDQLAEPTIVIFWGDHLPSVYGDVIFNQNSLDKMHETPLLIYSNVNKKDKELGMISPIYFAPELLEVANADITGFYALLNQLQSNLPAFEKEMYLEKNTEKMKKSVNELSQEKQALLADYYMIQYDITTGKKYSLQTNLFAHNK
ncbi:LTA synthase family protein [Carnobacterium maltaromaticum]|uniref:LTA synthase family protein n=1 Tax=Carnobacterium maltaromaticum TaxID=2751 RepID=UPI00298B0576|nr:LTA synthase family protein [Carnobacterium maltaromaticum]MDW5523689.1 LTA synthase family protein [Carnobacterium maltaromaticum]